MLDKIKKPLKTKRFSGAYSRRYKPWGYFHRPLPLAGISEPVLRAKYPDSRLLTFVRSFPASCGSKWFTADIVACYSSGTVPDLHRIPCITRRGIYG